MNSINIAIAKKATSRCKCPAQFTFEPTNSISANGKPMDAQLGKVTYDYEGASIVIPAISIGDWIITCDSLSLGGLYQGNAGCLYYIFQDSSCLLQTPYEILINFVGTEILPLIEPAKATEDFEFSIVPLSSQ